MKRILFLVSSMEGGGAERVAALLSNYWVEHGQEVILMPTFSGRGDCVYPLDQRVCLDYLADRVDSLSRSPLNKLRRMSALRTAILEIKPDVVLSFLSHVNIAAIIAASGLSVPVVVSERTYPPAMPLGVCLDRLRRWLYPRASATVIQTQQALDWLNLYSPKANGVVISNPVVYPLPVHGPIISPLAVLDNKRSVVLAVGRLSEEKQFDLLIKAFKSLSKHSPNWDLVILGEGPERQRLEQLRHSLAMTERVHLPGHSGNLSNWYNRADVFVMSSRFEGFPNTLVEAMSHALPAISFDCDAGPRDIIRSGIDGLLVAPEEGVKGLTYALEALIQDSSRRHQMSKQAMSVLDRFSIQRISAAWDEVLFGSK